MQDNNKIILQRERERERERESDPRSREGGVRSDLLVLVPADEHGDAAPEDVEPGPLLPRHRQAPPPPLPGASSAGGRHRPLPRRALAHAALPSRPRSSRVLVLPAGTLRPRRGDRGRGGAIERGRGRLDARP
jgi:hypothetical protein